MLVDCLLKSHLQQGISSSDEDGIVEEVSFLVVLKFFAYTQKAASAKTPGADAALHQAQDEEHAESLRIDQAKAAAAQNPMQVKCHNIPFFLMLTPY